MKNILLILIFAILPFSVFAFELEGVQLNGGIEIILNTEDVSVSPAPNPAVPEFGVSVPIFLSDVFYFEPGLRIFGTTVILNQDTYKPVPAAIETADGISVLNLELRPELGAAFSLSEKMMIGVTGAPVFSFRLPIFAYDDADESQMTIVREYYFSYARFLSLHIGGFFSWDFTDDMALRIKIGTGLPVYHIWDGDDAGFFDQMTITPEIGILWRF